MIDVSTWGVAPTIFLADLAIRIGLSLRVIMRKRTPSVSIAWLVIILLVPFVGALFYLFFGENRLGERRADRLIKERPLLRERFLALRSPPEIDWQSLNPECEPLDRLVRATTGFPTLPGNDLELLEDTDQFFQQLIRDINQATSDCSLEFYILSPEGRVNDLIEALLAACQRGVSCRLLLDSIGSKQFLRSRIAARMRKAGIQVVGALPAGLIRALFVRIDLRNHRKIAVIDGRIGYTGSQNLIDPRYFKQKNQVGEWVDAMVRITGPAVALLAVTFTEDWCLERTRRKPEASGPPIHPPISPAGAALVQLVPSGPGSGEDTIHDLLLTTIYAARRELILTTPYLVPDNALLAALTSASRRGVSVTLIVPAKNDSRLVHYASRARYEALAQAGVRIMGFSGGLLHTKTITVDGDFSLFGSVNLDMRSFWLNFELTLCIYDRACTAQIRNLQSAYLNQASEHDALTFASRSFAQRLLENLALLVGPLL